MKKNILNKTKVCKNCKNPLCKFGCPLGNDIPKFIHYLKEENYQKAYHILSKTTVLPAICGIICPQEEQCQRMCLNALKDKHVEIGELEALVGQVALNNNYKIYSPKKTKHHVLVIGAGPAGLTCAAFLRRYGIKVTIYEKHDYLGGLLIHGIPDFRLDKALVNKVVNSIINLGIEVSYNKELGRDFSIDDVINNYDAIFLGIGSNISNTLKIEGEELLNVFGANGLLENNLKLDVQDKEVFIYGGGNTAMDMARIMFYKGANVSVLVRNDEKHLTASLDEYEDTKNKVKFLFNTKVTRLIGNDILDKVEIVKTKLDKDVLIDIENSKDELKCDYFIEAIGSHADMKILNDLNINLDNKNKIDIDGNGQTSNPKIFAGGDVSGIKSTVSWASRSGRNAAYAIIEFLKDK